MSENKSRAKFEAWADGKVTSLAMRLGSYMYADTSRAREAWLASRKAALEEAAQLAESQSKFEAYAAGASVQNRIATAIRQLSKGEAND